MFLAKMENILRLYALAYDECYPLLSFDERPCFLIGDVVKGAMLAHKAEEEGVYVAEYIKMY